MWGIPLLPSAWRTSPFSPSSWRLVALKSQSILMAHSLKWRHKGSIFVRTPINHDTFHGGREPLMLIIYNTLRRFLFYCDNNINRCVSSVIHTMKSKPALSQMTSRIRNRIEMLRSHCLLLLLLLSQRFHVTDEVVQRGDMVLPREEFNRMLN